ncbi:DUF2135 domain-containing protein [Flagellimonas sp.]|uniref:DUF2135 domain-containing protein n=1 Tax=Flagellimonas sp. TaxID=2058762 RepID=UPI003F4A5F86
MKKLLLIFALCGVTSMVSAQERWVSGTIFDGESPMSNVKIQVINQGTSATTNESGKYRISASTGDLLYYTSDGMEPIQIRVEDVTRILNVDMFPKIEKLDNVTVTRKRRASQKELEEDYYSNPNIIKTFFGYLDKDKVSYTARILDSDRILPGEFDLANVLRNRFPGITVANGAGFGTNFGAGPGVGFSGATGADAGRSVFLRPASGPAVFDIDGQIFTFFPDFLDVQQIERIGIITSLTGLTRYGGIARGGVIVINTKNGLTVPLRDEKGFIIDRARLKNNFYDGKALTAENISNNAPEYLKQLNAANTFEEAKSLYESNAQKYTSSPFFVLDSYQYFYDTWENETFADQIIDDAYPSISNNPVHLKSLAYIYEAQERFEKANETYKEVFILRPNYAQSYMDLANSNRSIGKSKKAAILYARYFYLLDEGFLKPDTTMFSRMMDRDFNNLLTLEKTDMVGTAKGRKIKVDREDFDGTRLVFEWSNSEAEFELQFVNPDNQFYTWTHDLESSADIISREKDFGYSTSEYLIDDSLSGVWKINAKYFGNKSLTPTYLKATIYHNYGTKSQRKEVKVFKLDVKNVNRELFKINKTSKSGI